MRGGWPLRPPKPPSAPAHPPSWGTPERTFEAKQGCADQRRELTFVVACFVAAFDFAGVVTPCLEDAAIRVCRLLISFACVDAIRCDVYS